MKRSPRDAPGAIGAGHGTRPPAVRPDRAAWARWAVVVPALTLGLFVGLSALGLFELRGRRSGGAPPREPVSEALRRRYERESAALGDLRQRARERTSVEAVVRALRAEDPEKIPPAAHLVSDLRALDGGRMAAGASAIPALLAFLRALPEGGEDVRRERAEAVLSEVVFAAASEFCLEPRAVDDLFACLERAAREDSALVAVLLQCALRFAEDVDVARLEDLRRRVQDRQLAFEFDRTLEALRNRRAAGARKEPS